MIEFDLEVSPELLEVLLPFLVKAFRESSGRFASERFVSPSSGDEDFDTAWSEGLVEDGRVDRLAFSRLLERSSLESGCVEIPEAEAEEVLRGMTDLRLSLRERGLQSVTDEDLENGRIEMSTLAPEARMAYLSYLLLAEMQERLIMAIG